MEEIDLFLTPDDSMPPGIETDHYDSEGDILFFEELLTDDSLSLPENELLPTQPTLCPVIQNLIPFSFENVDKVLLLSHWGFKALQLSSKSPMLIHEDNTPNLGVHHLHFYPLTISSMGGIRIGWTVMTLVLAVLSSDHSVFTSSASFGNPIS
ncbi:hypothetical protein Tco_0613168 [Tanacetum coccineum]